MIRFRCPNCKQKFSVPESYIGKALVCTGCETKVAVPAFSTIAERSSSQPPSAPPRQVSIVSAEEEGVFAAAGDNAKSQQEPEVKLTPPDYNLSNEPEADELPGVKEEQPTVEAVAPNASEVIPVVKTVQPEPRQIQKKTELQRPTVGGMPAPVKRFSLKDHAPDSQSPASMDSAPNILRPAGPASASAVSQPVAPRLTPRNPAPVVSEQPLRQPPPLPAQPQTFGNCPKCNAGLRAKDAALCVSCGHNLRPGIQLKPSHSENDSKVNLAFLGGAGAVLVMVAIWVPLAVALDWAISWFILFIGLVAGGAMCLLCPNERGSRIGLLSMGLTSFGWILGICLIAKFMGNEVKPNYQKQISLEDTALYIVEEMHLKKEISDQTLMNYRVYGSGFFKPPESIKKEFEEFKKKITDQAHNMPKKDRAELEAKIKTRAVQNEPYIWKLIKVVSILDLLWVGLALSVAYKIGYGVLSRY